MATSASTCVERAKALLGVSRVKECRDLSSREELADFCKQEVVVIKPLGGIVDDIVILYPRGGRRNRGTRKFRSSLVQTIMVKEGDGLVIYNVSSNGLRLSVRSATKIVVR